MGTPRAEIGKDGWLFLTGDSNRVMQQISGNFDLPSDFEKNWEELGQFRREQFEKRDIRYTLFIAPNKECVYSEYLPEGVILSDLRPVSKVLGAISPSVSAVYPLQTLKLFRKYQDTYSKGDTHWNHYGAFCAYQVLMTSLGIKPLSNTDIAFSAMTADGDLSSKIGQKTEIIESKIVNDKTAIVYSNGVKNVGGYVVLENQDRTLPTLVLFRDSFSSNVLRMIAQHFSRVVAVWQPNIDYSIVDKEKPNYVISQQAERFIAYPPDDLGGKSNEQFVEEKKAK